MRFGIPELDELTPRMFNELPYIDPEGPALDAIPDDTPFIVIEWSEPVNAYLIAHYRGYLIASDFGFYRIGELESFSGIAFTLERIPERKHLH